MKHWLRTITWKFADCQSRYPELNTGKVLIRGPEDVIRHFQFLFKDEVKERFVVIWLNSANIVTGFEIISEGILNSSLVHPREIFRGAIVATCASLILAHNHPSENPEPSAEDLAITKQLTEAGKIIGIPIHDHIIFAGRDHTSLAERGII